MKKNIKMWLVSTLAVLCSLCVFVACDKANDSAPNNSAGKTEVVFSGYQDETVSVKLGESYIVDTTAVKGSDGKYYSVQAEILNSQGEHIDAVGGSFLIVDAGGYTITYTTVVDGKTHTKRVTLKIELFEKPNIYFGKCEKTVPFGATFTLPTVNVYDLTGETIIPTVTVLDSDGENVAVTNNTISCEKVGKYLLKASAKNSAGLEGEAEYEFFVRSEIEDSEYENFSDEGVYYEIDITTRVEGVEWLESYFGREGVMKFDLLKGTQYNEMFTVYPRKAFKDYLAETNGKYDYSYIVYSMYVDAPEGSIKSFVPLEDGKFISPKVQYGMWYDYVFDANGLLGIYKKYQDNESGLVPRKFKGTFCENASIYIDKIGFAKSLTELPVSLSETEFAVNETVDFNAELNSAGDMNMQYTLLIDGKPYAITDGKYTFDCISDNYTLIASSKDGNGVVVKENKYKLSVVGEDEATINEFTAYVEDGEERIAPALQIKNAEGNDVTESYQLTTVINCTTNAGKRYNNTVFSSARSGLYEYELSALNESTGVSFKKIVYVTVGPRGEKELIDVERADAATLFASQIGEAGVVINAYYDVNNMNESDYTGAKVVRFGKVATTNTVKFNFQPIHTASYYEKYTKAYIPFYVETDNQTIKSVKINLLGVEYSLPLYETLASKSPRAWTTLELPMENLLTAMSEGKLYPLVTHLHHAMEISVESVTEEGDLSGGFKGSSVTACFGSMTVDTDPFNPVLFSPTAETYKLFTHKAKSNQFVDETTLSAMNIAGNYTGTAAVSLRAVSGNHYELSGVSNNFIEQISAYDKLSMWIAVVLNDGYTPTTGEGFRFTAKDWGVDNTALFSQSNGFGSNFTVDGTAGKEFNTWYQLTIDVEKLTAIMGGESIKIFVAQGVKDGTANTLNNGLFANCRILIGDITVYNETVNE